MYGRWVNYKLYVSVKSLVQDSNGSSSSPFLPSGGSSTSLTAAERRVHCWGDVSSFMMRAEIWWYAQQATPPSAGPGSPSWCCSQTRWWCCLSGRSLWCRYRKSIEAWVAAWSPFGVWGADGLSSQRCWRERTMINPLWCRHQSLWSCPPSPLILMGW